MRSNDLFLVLAAVHFGGHRFLSAITGRYKGTNNWQRREHRDHQADVALTSYNNYLALAKEQRRIKLQKGVFDVRFMHMASQVINTSVHVRFLVDPESLKVLEQNYEYDLPNNIHVKRSTYASVRIIITRGRYEEALSNQKIGVLVVSATLEITIL
jgi:hypothetical protein